MSVDYRVKMDRTRLISSDPITRQLQLTKIAIDVALDTHQMTQSLEHWLAAESENIEKVLEEYNV